MQVKDIRGKRSQHLSATFNSVFLADQIINALTIDDRGFFHLRHHLSQEECVFVLVHEGYIVCFASLFWTFPKPISFAENLRQTQLTVIGFEAESRGICKAPERAI